MSPLLLFMTTSFNPTFIEVTLYAAGIGCSLSRTTPFNKKKESSTKETLFVTIQSRA